MFRRRSCAVALAVSSSVASAGADPPRPSPPRTAAGTSADPQQPTLLPVVVTASLAREAVAVALRSAGFSDEWRTLASLSSRARSAAAWPEVSLRVARTTDDSLHLTPTTTDPNGYSVYGGAGWWLEGRLVWHLDRLAFDRDEISVERLRRERADAAAKLVNRVLDTLFAWQRAALREKDPKSTSEDMKAAAVSRAEAEVTLDVLTAGWFGARGVRSR